MLTSLYYYNYYKPFIIGGKTTAQGVAAARRKPLDLKDYSQQTELTRDVFPKKDVVDYAKGFAGSVTGLKDAAKTLSKNADAIKFAAVTEGLDSAIDWLSEDVDRFVGSVNNSRAFSGSQVHSHAVTQMTDSVGEDMAENSGLLNQIGVEINENGILKFSNSKTRNLTFTELGNAVDGLKNIADNVYGKVSNFLTKPLSEHMNFRSLNYYFDYKLGGIKQNSFQLVESGMLINVLV